MSIPGHFRRWHLLYRFLSGFFAFAFLMGYFWGTHPMWHLCPVVIVGMCAVIPRVAFLPAQVAFSILILPTLALIYQRLTYLWDVPYPNRDSLWLEVCLTGAMLLTLLAVAVLTFRPAGAPKHVT